MKCEAKRIETPPAFQPVELTLRFENLAELAVFYAVFNYTKVSDPLESLGLDTTSIRRAIDDARPIGTHDAFQSAWYDLKTNIMREFA
ncbi:MAG: hypothetical protein IT367_13870 [Candidatus Hydrogenedentes bacterium]|nr:hypothetical protein [Candidatus Hydrogenedentota bacterium]